MGQISVEIYEGPGSVLSGNQQRAIIEFPLGSTKPSHAAAKRHFCFQLSRFRIMSDTTLAVKSTMGTMRA